MYDVNNEIVGFKINGKSYYYEKDYLGSIIAIRDDNADKKVGYKYNAFGNVVDIEGDLNLANKNPFRFRSYYYDVETGFYYLKNRYYDPNVGRFISTDSIEYIKCYEGIEFCNLYRFCNNSPINYTDYTGKKQVSKKKPPNPESGYKAPKGGAKWDKNKKGWKDKHGNVWVPDLSDNPHSGEHWDVQGRRGGYINVYPDGSTRGGRGKVTYMCNNKTKRVNVHASRKVKSNVRKVTKIGTSVAIVYGSWVVLKWTIGILAVPYTCGGSVAIVAVTP